MLIPHVSNAIAVWKTLEGPHLSFNNATLYAVKDGNKTSFYLEQDERVSHFVMRNVVGWIEHKTLGTDQQSVYRRFYPFIDMEGSTVIFAVFIKSVSSEMPGKVVAFFQNRKFVVLFSLRSNRLFSSNKSLMGMNPPIITSFRINGKNILPSRHTLCH